MDKKEQIIHAAMKLLIEHGVQGTPMSAIAREAGTGIGTMYNYFPAKEDLINAIYIYIKQDEQKVIGVPFDHESIKKQVEHFYKAMIHYMLDKPMHFWFSEQFNSSPIITDTIKAEGLKGFAYYTQVLKKGQQQGIIKSMDLEELTQFVHGGIRGFIRWILTSGKPLTNKLLDDQLRMSWDAMRS